MKTTFDIQDTIYTILRTPQLEATLYKRSKPDNSKASPAVVIVTGSVTGEQLQQSVVNVNAYANDIDAKIGGVNQSIPDVVTLKKLTEHIISKLDNRYEQDYGMYVEFQSDPIAEREIRQHYVNVRVKFTFEPS